VKIILNPTHADFTSLKVEELSSGVFQRLIFAHAKRDCGKRLIQKLAKLEISSEDELHVVLGPGNFTAIRNACLIGNAVKFLTNCKLFARKLSSQDFHKVDSFQPFYATPPKITIAKK